MYPKIFLIEDDEVIAKFYQLRLRAAGFEEIDYFPDTEAIEQKLIDGYTRPSIILSDYFIKPITPSLFVPRLRAARMDAPLIIASGAVEMESLNHFAMQGWLQGFFSKQESIQVMISRICQHLIDLSELAASRFEEWKLLRQFTEFADNYTRAEALAIRRLLLLHDFKQIQSDTDISERKLYYLREALGNALPGTQQNLQPRIMLDRALARRAGL